MLAVHLCAQCVFMAQGEGLNFIKHTSIQLGPAVRLTSLCRGTVAWGVGPWARKGRREMPQQRTTVVVSKQR